MDKNVAKWILSTLGIASTAFSLVLLFPVEVKAACTIFVTCPSGGIISCSGDFCSNTETSVTCTIRKGDKDIKETKYCPSGGGGGPGELEP